MRYSDISRHTGIAYNKIGALLTQGTGSPTFFDMALLANAAQTSLDYLGELTGLFHPEQVVDPGRYLSLSDKEMNLILRVREKPVSVRNALLTGFVENLEARPLTPSKEKR